MNTAPIPLPSTEQWLLQQTTGIASAVSRIYHTGLVHGNIKCENILLFDCDGIGSLCKVSDFGSARLSSFATVGNRKSPVLHATVESQCTTNGRTDAYCSPPQKQDTQENDTWADIWALGCIMFEVLAWYFQPPGYSSRGFQRTRVQTLQKDGSAMMEDLADARFCTLDAEEQPMIHPSVRGWLDDIKSLSRRSRWLLDVPYCVERLLSVNPETTFTALDLEQLLQHSLSLKQVALQDLHHSVATPKCLENKEVDCSPETYSDSAMQQRKQVRRADLLRSSHAPKSPESGPIMDMAQSPTLRRMGQWTQDEVRRHYLEIRRFSSKERDLLLSLSP